MIRIRYLVLAALVGALCVPTAFAQQPTTAPVSVVADDIDITPASAPAVTPVIVPIAATAPAATPATVQEPAAARFLNELIDILLKAAILPLVIWATGRLISYFEKKSGVHVSDETKARINGYMEQGVNYAEEQAHKAIKKNEKKLEMPEKLEHAASFIMDIADKKDAKDWTADKVKKMIEAWIAKHREPNGVTK